ncbi:SusC/RagA family TonB-linked outer membrane protein [Algibacter pacificus]|uniref:SusC/RagA family TonB-linked outer membrane protein n=1 Tax=Algibacter pacificus TaxID=2599389 RepID=UPI0011C963F2|nr:SusC/RagA family TonB-linked outer membrane protein [Algibacter pacificus]
MKLKTIQLSTLNHISKIKYLIYLCVLITPIWGYSFSSKSINIEAKSLNSQDIVITGKVTDVNGQPIPGVNIIEKNTSNGVYTDFDGNYSISVNKEGILVFSFIGFESQEIAFTDSNRIDVVLVEDSQQLDQVIVTALGEKRSVKSLGYAATNIKGESITETAQNNVINSLIGKVAGLDISNTSGGVGSSSRIILRGVKTIGGDSDQPLFVVDGVPVSNSIRSNGRVDYGNGISDINPDDIAEITVLKSAAAAALYGSSGANGVIVITTKNGGNGKNLGVQVNSSIALSTPLRLIDYQNEYGTGTVGNEYNYFDGVNNSAGWGNAFGVQPTALQWNSPVDENGDLVPLDYKAYPDNGRDFYDTGVTRDNSISIGKSEKDKYNFKLSLRNIDEKGMIPTTRLKRNFITFNAGAYITKKFKVNASLNYSNIDSPNRATTQNFSDNPIKMALIIPRHVDVNALRNYKELLANGVPLPFEITGDNPEVIAPGWDAISGDFFPNPFFTLDNNKNIYSNDRMFSVLNLTYNITDWLSIDSRVSKEFIGEKKEKKTNEGVRLWNGSQYSYKGSYFRDQYTRNNTFANVLLKGHNKIGSFGIGGLIGVETKEFILDGSNQRADELELPNLFHINNAVGEPRLNQYHNHTKTNSAFGQLDIDYKKQIYLTLTGRNDWNSTLPKSNRSFFYPSASLSLIVSDMVKLPTAFSYFKLRGNVGRVGIGTGAYQVEQSLLALKRLTGVFEASVANGINNPTLKPTRTTTYEIGADIRLFQSRLNFDIAAYIGKSEDQIQRVQLPASSGYSSRIINAGDIENKGIEIAINTTNIEGKDFSWESSITYSKNINKVLSLAPGLDELLIASRYSQIRSVARAGEPYGQLMGYGYKRDLEGNIVHSNGYAVKTDEQIVLGNVTPDWLGGFSNTFKYKGLTLTAQINARIGGDMFSLTNQWAARRGLSKSTLSPNRSGSIVADGVIDQGNGVYVANNVSVPYQNYIENLNSYGFHEPVIYDASYVKLRSLQLYYTLPKKIVNQLPFQSIRFGVIGSNLAILYSKAPNFDPEGASSARNSDLGFDEFNMPTAKTYTFKVSLNF